MKQFLLFMLIAATFCVSQIQNHDLKVKLHVDRQQLTVQDTLTLDSAESFTFVLHAPLDINRVSPGWKIEKISKGQIDSYGINSYFQELDQYWPLQAYRAVNSDPNNKQLTLHYTGQLYSPPSARGEQYSRSFGETPGIIVAEGVYLASSSFWYPRGQEKLISFRVEIESPDNWSVISQGKEVQDKSLGNSKSTVWDCRVPMEEIYLVGGPLRKYASKYNQISTLVYLREHDPGLANKYIQATAEYLEMYENLLGNYPYSKFALVENFWETGYGMPSFTLLGPRVIRFPFILRSSYPHEILHNWWGNGVFVDYDSGNWCEGLTAYLADHLMKEMQGQGAVYRREILQKYRNFVRSSKDFPLTQFRSRHSAATEAVGYGKSLMLFHALRRKVGDQNFIAGLKRFYQDYRFQKASFQDIEKVFSATSGQDLSRFFQERVTQKGAPEIRLENVNAQGNQVSFTVTQSSQNSPYQLRLPVAITVQSRSPYAVWKELELTKNSQTFSFDLPAPVLRVDLDPEFDTFRRLDRKEIPASLGQIFGAETQYLVYASGEHQEHYRNMANSWVSGPNVKVISDRQMSKFPKDASIWFIGPVQISGFSLAKHFAQYDQQIQKFDLNTHSLILTSEHPENPELAIGWIQSPVAALPSLARKLPHYRKYSYLAFQGEEANNVWKGQWQVTGSPMTYFVSSSLVPAAKFPEQKPLTDLPSPINAALLKQHVKFLSDTKMKGRGLGTPELDKAAEYIANYFQDLGLKPGGDNGSYMQQWQTENGEPKRNMTLKNVVAVLPGSDPNLANSPVVIGAHYDHLGEGWPDVKSENKGKIHPGADDNASGIAVLLELARNLHKGNHKRSVVFVAFTGEEAGRLGSRHFVSQLGAKQWKVMGMINLDSVGRLENRKLTIFGTGTAYQWPFIINGYASILNIAVNSVPNHLDSSDHTSFLKADIPAIHMFSGAHLDYHSPNDTEDKIDYPGMVSVTTLLKEMVVYMADRDQPFTSGKVERQQPTRDPHSTEQRRASLGTIPSFGDQGEGVLISGVVPNSPAEKAGLKKGDRILKIGDYSAATLAQFADALKKYAPGDTVTVSYMRDGKTHNVQVTLSKR